MKYTAQQIEAFEQLNSNVTDWCINYDLWGTPTKQYVKLHKQLTNYSKTVTLRNDVIDADMEESGVSTITDKNLQPLLEAFYCQVTPPSLKLSFTQWVTSWGIVQHTDPYDVDLIIPIIYDGYTFGYHDWNDVLRQKHWKKQFLPTPVVFAPNNYHSLAPCRQIKKPFLAVAIDFDFV